MGKWIFSGKNYHHNSFKKDLLSNYDVLGTIVGNKNTTETNQIHRSLLYSVYS